MNRIFAIVSALCVFCATACEPRHIKAYTPRQRLYAPGSYAETDKAAERSANPGSLWSQASPSLFEDLRAARVGDIVTVVIDENSKGEGDAETKLGTEASAKSGIANFLGLVAGIAKRYPDMDPTALIDLVSKSDFAGSGSTSRSGRLDGRIAVRVKRVLPNGDLYVEGSKVILLNEEELHFYVSGVIRPSDVNPDNSVRSSLIADAQVEFSGRGTITDQQSPGWLQSLLDTYSPI
ncbi:MAG: flagellar basal body L-ring protein FlgH [Deltaproteobacteria bacterium]|nr:flagellar basal body L-ring protein FlgH [Deltaproteobacteria bacterium]